MSSQVQAINLETLCTAIDITKNEDEDVIIGANYIMKMHEKFMKQQVSQAVRNCKAYVQRLANTDDNKSKVKLPNLIDDNIECTSDELNKKFIYKCRYSPSKCSKIVKSYGSEEKARHLMKQHVMEHHLLEDPSPNVRKRRRVILRKDKMPSGEPSKYLQTSSKELCSVKPVETSDGSMLQKQGLDFICSKDFNVIPDTLKFGQLEHDYATSDNKCPRRCDNSSSANRATEQKKNHHGKVSAAHKQIILSSLKRSLDGESYVPPPHVGAAPLPFVFVPQPFEPAQIVEFYSNCEPVGVVQPASVHRNDKTSEHHADKITAEFARTANASRSVLECVENRVTCKPSASTEQGDGITPDNSIENAENLKESYEIAERNIKILEKQKRKRRTKSRVNICELCKRSFTANTSLTCHYKVHHLNIKPFKCHLCTNTFTRLHSLKYHLMIHDDRIRFQCNICNKGFRHPTHYRDHVMKHSGDQSFSCKFCSNNFKTRIALRRHAKSQHQNSNS